MDQVVLKLIAVLRIQKFIRRIQPRNVVCALTYEPLKKSKAVFRFYPDGQKSNATGKLPIGYDLEAMLDYIQTVQKLIDPCTRLPYTVRDLQRMQYLIAAHKLERLSPLVEYKKRIAGLRAESLMAWRGIVYPGPEYLDIIAEPIEAMLYNAMDPVNRLSLIDRKAAVAVCRDIMQMVSHPESLNGMMELIRERIELGFKQYYGTFIEYLEDRG